jgi:hypothetical protein
MKKTKKTFIILIVLFYLNSPVIAQSSLFRTIYNYGGLVITGYSEITNNGSETYAIVKNNGTSGIYCKGFNVKARHSGIKEVYSKGEYVDKPFKSNTKISLGEFYIGPGETFYSDKSRKDASRKTYYDVKNVQGSTKEVIFGTNSNTEGYSDLIKENTKLLIYQNDAVKVEAFLKSSSSNKISSCRVYDVKFSFTNLTSQKIEKKQYNFPEKVTFWINGVNVEYKFKQPKNLKPFETYSKETFDFYSQNEPPVKVKFQ